VYRVNRRVGQQIVVVRIAFLNAKRITNLIQFVSVALANRVHDCMRVPLVNRDKFSPESEANDGYVQHNRMVKKLVNVRTSKL